MDTSGFSFIDLFAGIGGMRLAFERTGGDCVFSSEIDDDARTTYERNFGDEPAGDIRDIAAADVPDHDVLLAGFPCPSFSIMGEQDAFDDARGELFFEIERLLDAKQPDAFLLENVKNLTTMHSGAVIEEIVQHLEATGYTVYWRVLNALDFGLPQTRERVIFVGFRDTDVAEDFEWPEPDGTTPDLADVLEDNPDDEFTATEYIREKRQQQVAEQDEEVFEPSMWHENRSGNVSVLPHATALRANASYNYLLVNGRRHPTTRELCRLQGFPDDFEVTGSRTAARKQLGNSVPVPVIEAVAEQVVAAFGW